MEQTPTRPVAGASHMPNAVGRHDQHHQQQTSNGASSSQFMVTASNRLMPVQITIPAQPGHPNSVPKALTVQVPAHALQPGSQTSPILQQVLTQAITQALNLQDSMQAALYLQGQINNAFKLDIWVELLAEKTFEDTNFIQIKTQELELPT